MKQHLSMPADFNHETIDQYAELNSCYTHLNVLETYGNLNPQPLDMGTGRTARGMPKVGLEKLEKYIAHSRKQGLSFNYTFNSPCTNNLEFTSKGNRAFTRFLERLESIGCDFITLSAPSLIGLVHGMFPGLRIAVSTIAEVDSVFAAKQFEQLGVDRIILNEDILRDFRLLKAIKRAVAVPIEAIANTRCLHLCPLKPFDFNFLSHCGSSNHAAPIHDYYKWHCTELLFRNPAEWIKMPWIRPEDLHLYDMVDIFKIIGRQLVYDGDPVKTAECYMRGHFDGNLIELLGLFAPKRLAYYPVVIHNKKLDGLAQVFLKNVCRQNLCHECKYCEEFAKKAIDPDSLAIVEQRAFQFQNVLHTYHSTCNSLGMDEEQIIYQTIEWS